jgi:hypothetical protein
MKLTITGIALAVATAFTVTAQAQQVNERKVKNAEEDRIEAAAKADKARCDTLKANAKDICIAEAKGKERVAKAELDAKTEKDQAKAQKKVADAKAEAAYDVASQKCDDQKGEAKDACIKQAKVERDRAKGTAEKQADAKHDKQRAATGGTAPERKPETPKAKP